MKKLVMFAWMLFFAGGVSFAAPTPELLESLTTQILEQQTKTKSAKEVLDQLKPIFSHCATSHKDEAVQAVCKSFLEKQFVSLEKKWTQKAPMILKHLTSVITKPLWKLEKEGRFQYLGIPALKKEEMKVGVSPKQLEYTAVNFPEYQFSFLIPSIDQKFIPAHYASSCSKLLETVKKNISFLEKNYPEDKKQLADLKATLKETQCLGNLDIKIREKEASILRDYDILISSPIDAKGEKLLTTISKKDIPVNSNFEEAIKTYYDQPTETTKERKFISSVVYTDTKGKLYYTDTPEYLNRVSKDSMEVWYAGEVKNLSKRTLGVGKHLQAKIEKGEAKVALALGDLFIWLKESPAHYYQIGLDMPQLRFGNYIAVDLNNPDGISSFLSK